MDFHKQTRSDRPGVTLVVWREDGKRRRKNFPSDDKASAFIRDQKILSARGATPSEVVAASRVAAGTGYSLEALARVGLEALRKKGDGSMTFRQAADRCIASAQAKHVRERTLTGYRYQFDLLSKTFGDRIAATMTNDEVTAFLDHLPDRRGRESHATAETRRTNLRLIRQVLHAAGVEDPLDGVHVADDGKDVEHFTVDQVRQIFAASRPVERGFLAVAVFAGIRPENLEKMPASAVVVKDRKIWISADQSKDGFSHLFEGGKDGVLAPIPVLWTWLKEFPYQPVKWSPLQHRLRRALGFWIQDGLRHTAATYYHARFGTAATARLLGHAGESLVRRHYARPVESAHARLFHTITPPSIKYPPPAMLWPTDSKLAAMLLKTPAVRLCKQLGVSDSALSKRCRVRGISKPGVGYWTKRQFETALK